MSRKGRKFPSGRSTNGDKTQLHESRFLWKIFLAFVFLFDIYKYLYISAPEKPIFTEKNGLGLALPTDRFPGATQNTNAIVCSGAEL